MHWWYIFAGTAMVALFCINVGGTAAYVGCFMLGASFGGGLYKFLEDM